jgi:hypothetical protein
MGRPPLPVGTYANISVRQVAPGRHRARCRFRDYDGQVRYVVRFGPSQSSATRNLKAAMVDRVAAAGPADLTRNAKVIDLSAAWLIEVEASVLAQSTKARYAMIVRQFITPGLGQLRLRELSVPAVDRLLRVTVEKQDDGHVAGRSRALRPGHRRPARTRPTISDTKRLHGPQNRLYQSCHSPGTARLTSPPQERRAGGFASFRARGADNGQWSKWPSRRARVPDLNRTGHGTALLAQYRSATFRIGAPLASAIGTSDSRQETTGCLPMTARCASATNPVAPGTASVIPPTKTQAAVPDETSDSAEIR